MEPRTTPLMHRPHGTALHVADRTVLSAIAFLVVVATSVAFIESFDGLLKWSEGHGLDGWRAYIWPLQLDAFIAIGEGALFIAVLRSWDLRGRIFAWTVTLSGAVVSIAANIGHVGSTSWTDQATAGVPPLAAVGGLTIGLQLLKRVIRDQERRLAAEMHAQGLLPEAAPEDVTVTAERVERRPGALRRGLRALKQVMVRPEPLAVLPEPEPAPVEVPVLEREPEPAPALLPAPSPEPVPAPVEVPGSRHPLWQTGVEIYRRSVKDGAPLSERALAAEIGQKNRTLAKRIINYVKEND